MKAHRIYRNGRRLVVQFPYDPDLNDEVKKFRGWSFNPNTKQWTIPEDVEAEKFRDFVNDHGFAISPFLADKYDVREKEESDSVRKSKATDANLSVPNLNPDLDLYAFQRAVIDYIVDKKKCLVAEPMGSGKAQPLDAKVLTPDGFVEMRDISVGDYVIGGDGCRTQVLGVYPQGQKDIYEVTFSDGSSTRCTADHLWATRRAWEKVEGVDYKVRALAELGGTRDGAGNKNWFIPTCDPVRYESSKELPVSPYVLGALLGDGGIGSGTPEISSGDAEIPRRISKELGKEFSLNREGKYDYRITFSGIHRRNKLKEILQSLGVWGCRSHEKFIPKAYMHASPSERLYLLQGLMDTDGTPNGSAAQFSSSSKTLCENVREIVWSLGGTATYFSGDSTYTYNGESLEGRERHRLYIRMDQTPFTLPRKIKGNPQDREPTRSIESIEFVGRDRAKCIRVDSPDGLYVTDDYIVTHNTGVAISAAQKMRAYPVLCVVPSSVKLNWAKEYIKWIPNCEGHVSILDGTKLDDRPPMSVRVDGRTVEIPVNDLSKPIVIMNYAILSLDVERDGSTTVPGPIMEEIEDRGFRSLILDEAHAAKGDSLRSHACEYLADKMPVNLLLTGTPIVNKPKDLIRPLKIMGNLESFGGWEHFTRRYCNRQEAPWGLDISGAKHLDELHYKLRDTCMVRHSKEQIMPHLPSKDRLYIPLELEKRAPYEDRLADFEEAQKQDQDRKQILGKMAKLRKELAKQKASPVIEWVKDFLESGEKLILFAVHRPLQRQLLDRFDDAARIVSGDDNQTRQDNVERFQKDEDCQLIICAMGTSLTSSPGAQGHTLTAASHVAIAEPSFSPKHMEQAEDRAHREGQENNVHVHYLVGADTIDEHILEMADRRRNVADNAIDGTQDLKQEFIQSYGS